MNFDHKTIAEAQSPELDLTVFGTVEKPFLTLPSLRSVAAKSATRSDASQTASCSLAIGEHGVSAAAPDDAPKVPGAAADFSGAQVAEGVSASIKAVLQRRAEQVAKGFDAESDDRLPIGHLLIEAQKYANDARDWLNRKGQDPEHKHYHHKLVSSIALGLAELEKLDRKAGGHG